MAKQKQLSPKYKVWIDARKKHKLSHAHIQMACELGMNPKKFGKLDNHKQEPWKAPLPITNTFEAMESIETVFGPGKMTGQDLVGINRLILGPIPLSRILDGKVEFEFLQ